jgi:hypothetical protein
VICTWRTTLTATAGPGRFWLPDGGADEPVPGDEGCQLTFVHLVGALRPQRRLAATLAAPAPTVVPTFVLAWHPQRYQWGKHGYEDAIEVTATGGTWSENWTVGVRRAGIRPGDRAVLYRQYQDRGLVASGTFTSGIKVGEHWDGSGRQARYGEIDWDTVLDYEDRLPLEELRTKVPEVKWAHIQGSGIEVEASAVRKLSDLW